MEGIKTVRAIKISENLLNKWINVTKNLSEY